MEVLLLIFKNAYNERSVHFSRAKKGLPLRSDKGFNVNHRRIVQYLNRHNFDHSFIDDTDYCYRTVCRPIGLGLSGERVENTPNSPEPSSFRR